MSDVSATDVAAEPQAGEADAASAAADGSETAAPAGNEAATADGAVPVSQPAPMSPAGVGGVLGMPAGGGLDKLVNVALEVSVELGRTRVTLSEVLDYDVGSVVELDRAAGAPVDVRVNDTLLAQGEVVLIDDEYAVRITAIFDPNQPHR